MRGALLMEPRVLLADEPTGNLDSEASNRVVQLFRAIGEKHRTTIVMVTHSRDVPRRRTALWRCVMGAWLS